MIQPLSVCLDDPVPHGGSQNAHLWLPFLEEGGRGVRSAAHAKSANGLGMS